MKWVPVLVMSVGCNFAVGTLEDGFEADLGHTGGCGDLYAFAVNPANDTLLEVSLDGAEDGTISLPDPAAEVDVELGSRIGDAACTDVIVNGGPKVRATWRAVSGDVTVAVHPGDTTSTAPSDQADVTLTDVVLESDDGDQVTVESFEWTDLPLGFFPG